jgi:glycosyltransferase involved in cell wall biosynthesis
VRVTVLLPVYNAGPYLGQAIRSILAQDLGDFEFLIIDDRSRDRSAEVIRSFARKDGRIKAVFHAANKGLAATLNEGIETASGELIARMDQDDESLPARLSVQRKFMMENPEVAAAGTFVYHMGKKDQLITLPTSPEAIRTALPQMNCFYHASVMFRRAEVLALGGYRAEFKSAEDYDLWLRLSEKHELANIPTPLLRYRFTLEGMSLSKRWEMLLYHYLALASHARRDLSLEQAMEIARVQRDSHDREKFLFEVYSVTFQEHLTLRNWGAAAKLLLRIFREQGPRAGLKAVKKAAAR